MIGFWLLNIIIWTIFAFYNYCHIHKKYDFHPSGAFFALLIAIAFVYVPMMYQIYTWQDMLLIFITTLTLRWIVFDIAYNLFCKKQWWYYGNMRRGVQNSTPYQKNGTIDRTLKLWQIPIKIILLILTIIYSV